MQKGHYAYISWNSIKENFKHGFEWDNEYVHVKGYLAQDGTMAAALWNPTGVDQEVTILRNGKATRVTVKAERATAVEIG